MSGRANEETQPVDDNLARMRNVSSARLSRSPHSLPLWGWARIHMRNPERRALGYYFRDRAHGPSFNVLFDLSTKMRTEQMRVQAAALAYRGIENIALGSHVAVNLEGLSKSVALAKRYLFDVGSNTVDTMLLKLTHAERRQLGLPESPEWLAYYI